MYIFFKANYEDFTHVEDSFFLTIIFKFCVMELFTLDMIFFYFFLIECSIYCCCFFVCFFFTL